MMLMNQGNLLCISMQITYMVGQCLLYSGFKWLSQQKVDTSSENSPTGYILEIGLKYLDDELQELHDDYLLATEKLEISHDILSKHCCIIANKCGIKISGANKLVSNLVSKSKYVIHYTNLQ